MSKTHCIHGHAMTPENTHTRADGRTGCRTCRLASSRAYKKRNPAASRRHRKPKPAYEAVKRYVRIPVSRSEPINGFLTRIRMEHKVPDFARVTNHGDAIAFDWYETRRVEAA
jgi:hypothetical protein